MTTAPLEGGFFGGGGPEFVEAEDPPEDKWPNLVNFAIIFFTNSPRFGGKIY